MMKSKLANNLKLVQSGILIAFQNGNCEALKILMNSPLTDLFEDEVNLLHCVVLTSKVEFLKILISDRRVDINRTVGETDGRTPLMVACTSGKNEMVKEILKHPKVDVNAQDEIREWFALCYALHMGTPETIKLLLNHKDISHSSIQESLLMGLSAVSFEHFPIDLELLNMLLKKNFENEFILKNITNQSSEYHEHLQSWIAEELEMKIREEYHRGAEEVTEKSVCNKAFSVSLDVLHAAILKCTCLQCINVKDIKRNMCCYEDRSVEEVEEIYRNKVSSPKKTNLTRKISIDNCLVGRKVADKTKSNEVKCEFITGTLPDIFEHILFNGGHEKAIDDVINGGKSVTEIIEKRKKDMTVKDMQRNEAVIDFNKLCWSCSATQVKLYKCGGCRKARYCGKQCITNDWNEHMDYCLKVQKRRRK